ncbi:MAG: YitT family protein [Clostridioides sp.]|nr:YitT family protein [Clostridioides sp.]
MISRTNVERLLLIIVGSFILAFSMYNFYYLNNITEGGVLGILLLLKNLFNIKPSIANIIIDYSLFALGYKFFGKKFFISSIIASACFSVFYSLFESIGPILPAQHNLLISTILAGTTVGIGAGLVVRAGCAAGGDDALALIISKHTRLTLGSVYMIADCSILLLSLLYLSGMDVLYSVIAVTISGRVIDLIYRGGSFADPKPVAGA